MTPKGTDSIPVAGWFPVAFRIALVVLFLPLCLLLYYGFAPFCRRNPIPRVFLGGVASIFGLRIACFGNLSQKGAVLIANHVSWLDILAMAKATGAAFVAHDGLASIKPLRWLCRLNDTVFIARHDRKSVATQIAQVREAIRDTGALVIFPEGTTDDGSSLLPFKSSLLSALESLPDGVAVQPVWLDYGTDVSEIAWVGNEPGTRNALRILARLRPVELGIHILAPLEPEALASRKTSAAAAQSAIGRARDRQCADAPDQRVAL